MIFQIKVKIEQDRYLRKLYMPIVRVLSRRAGRLDLQILGEGARLLELQMARAVGHEQTPRITIES